METIAAFVAFALLFTAWVFAPSHIQKKASVSNKRDNQPGFLRPSRAA